MSMDEDSAPSRARSQSESAKSLDTPDGDTENAERRDEANATGDDENLPNDAEIDDEELFGETTADSP